MCFAGALRLSTLVQVLCRQPFFGRHRLLWQRRGRDPRSSRRIGEPAGACRSSDAMSQSSGSQDGDEVVGGGEELLQAKASPVAHSRRGGLSRSAKAACSASSSRVPPLEDTPPAPHGAVCHLCQKPDGLTHRYRSFRVHRACCAAIRAHGRLVAKDQAKRSASDLDFYKNTTRWRSRILPLVAPAGARTSAQRAVTKHQLSQTFDERITIRETLRLNMPGYVAFKTFWGRLSVSEAESAFVAELAAQQTDAENSDGEPTVTVKGIARVRHTQVHRLRASRSDDQKGMDAMSDDGPDSDDDDDDGRSDKSTRTRTSVGAHLVTPDPKRRKHSSTASTAAAPQPVESKHVALLKEKRQLADDIKRALDEHGGPRSVRVTLQKKMAGVDATELQELDLDPKAIDTAIDKTILAPLRALETRSAEGIPVKDVPAARAELNAIIAKAPEVTQPAIEAAATVNFLVQEVRCDKRKQHMTKRYHIEKYTMFFTNNGAGEEFAKWAAHAMCRREAEAEGRPVDAIEFPDFFAPDPETLQVEKVCIFVENEVPKNSLASFVRGIPETMKQRLGKCMGDTSKTLRKNKWASAMAKLEPSTWAGVGGVEASALQLDAPLQGDDGASPWLLAVRAWRWRFLPSEYPLQGFGHALLPFDQDMWLATFDLQILSDAGISAADLASHIETESGKDFMNEHACIVFMAKGAVAWIPFGTGVVVSFCPPSRREVEHEDSIANVIVATAFSPLLASSVSENLWKNVVLMNTKHLDKHKAAKPVASRAALVELFLASVQALRNAGPT